jgi:hypothetical protein
MKRKGENVLWITLYISMVAGISTYDLDCYYPLVKTDLPGLVSQHNYQLTCSHHSTGWPRYFDADPVGFLYIKRTKLTRVKWKHCMGSN